jgi:DNA-binding transcriptional ArsR family regulator
MMNPMIVVTQPAEQPVPAAPGSSETLKINFHNLKKAALVLRSLNHKLRQQILALIETEKRITVTEIYVRLRLEQSVASQHLAILRRAGIVTQRDGKFIYYTVNHQRIEEINQFIEQLIG